MEHQKILNLLNKANNSKFVTRKWNIGNDNLKSNYDETNEITYNTEICDFSDAYIIVRIDITIVVAPPKQVAFKNCGPLTKCITKIEP